MAARPCHKWPHEAPQGAHKRTDQKNIIIFWARGFWKVDPLGSPIRQFPGSLEGLGPTFVQQRLPPELPRATGTPQGAHKRTDIFTKKNCIFFWARVFWKVGPLGELFGRPPGPLGASRPIFVQQRLPPELPGAHGIPRGTIYSIFLAPPEAKFSMVFFCLFSLGQKA